MRVLARAAHNRLIDKSKALAMEKLRLPFLGPGWYQEAMAAGAKRDEGGLYFEPGAVVPPGLAAAIAAQGDKKRHKVTKSVSPTDRDTGSAAPAPLPQPIGADALALLRAEGAVLVRRARAAGVSDGKRWALRILERQAAGEPLSHYQRTLAREAMRL